MYDITLCDISYSADMGVQLLRQLGWKDGQGIGPRVRKNERQNRATGSLCFFFNDAIYPAIENRFWFFSTLTPMVTFKVGFLVCSA